MKVSQWLAKPARYLTTSPAAAAAAAMMIAEDDGNATCTVPSVVPDVVGAVH